MIETTVPRPEFCSRCGRKLVRTEGKLSSYSSSTGIQKGYTRLRCPCPFWRRWGFHSDWIIVDGNLLPHDLIGWIE